MQLGKLTKILNKKSPINQKNYFYFLILIIISFSFTYYSGYRGVYPIDSFIIFDSGYKVLNNIHPFKDYWTITGPFLDYLQSFFFLIDVNWFYYVLHAAFINCLLVLIFFYFLIKLDFNSNYSFLYAVSLAVLSYPSVGTPFVDHHAVYLSIIAVCYFILALKEKNKNFWILSSFFLVLSFFSKQIPSAYLAIFLIFVLFAKFFINKKKEFFYFFYGATFTVTFFLIFFLVNKIQIKDFFTQYIFYPMTIGDNRLNSLRFNFSNVFLQFKFIYLALSPLIFYSFLEIKKKKGYRNYESLFIAFITVITTLILIYCQLITKNQILIFFLIPWCLGISHYLFKDFKKINILSGVFIMLLIFTTIKYHLRFNEEKKFMELENVNLEKAVNAEILDPSLKGLKWIHKKYAKNPEYELKKLIEIKKIILKDQKKKIIVSDYQLLSFLTKNRNFAPNKWFDPLSIPNISNNYFQEYREFFISKLIEQKISNIYVIDESKLEILLPIFENPNCFSKSRLNEISVKLEISKCL